MIGKLIKQCALTVITAVGLVACGGGGGDPSIPDIPAGTTNNVVIGIVINPNSAQPVTELSTSTPSTVQITVTNNGAAVTSEIITLSTTLGSLTSTSLLTDTSGIATTTISAANISTGTAGVITATYQDTDAGINASQTLNVQAGVTSGNNVSLSITVIDPDTTLPANTATTELNTVLGNDIHLALTNNGTAVAGEIITVSTTVGTITPGTGNVLTNASGNANTATISSANVSAGTAGTITARYLNTNLGIDISENLNVQAGNTVTGGGANGSTVSLTTRLYDATEYALNPPVITRDAVTNAVTNVTDSTATEIDRINIVQPATLEAVLTIDGVRQENVIISVSTDRGILSPASGQIITNDAGIATLEVGVGTAVSGEAGTITVSAANETDTETFGIGSATLSLGTGSGGTFSNGSLAITNTSLSATGNTGVTVNVVDANSQLFSTPVQVAFSSPCVATSQATIDSPVTTSGGVATASYAVSGCEGSDTISASIVGVAGPAANGAVNIIASIPNSIAFSSATPTTIALQGTGGSGRLETADVVFRIIDNTGSPESGVTVNFSLSTDLGGITLVDNTASSNANGEVTATVSSGNIPTPVRVVATISLDTNGLSLSDVDGDGVPDADDTDFDGDNDGTPDNPAGTNTVTVTRTITTVSDVLVISTGLPDQNSFTIAASIVNPGGGDTIGVETVVSVSASDKFNNPVPDNTAINFTTEFGSIGASCLTVNGSCNVTWRSQNPLAHLTYAADDITTTTCNTTTNGNTLGIPCREDANFATPNGAFSTVLGYALGEESFVDSNGNGLFDTGEFVAQADLPEAFLDHNDDGDFGNSNTVGSCTGSCTLEEGDDEETFIDFDTDLQYDGPDGIYNGSLCSAAAEAANSCNTSLVNVFDTTTIVISSQTAFFGLYDNSNNLIGGSGLNAVNINTAGVATSVNVDVSDHFNGPLPGGTLVTVTTTNCDIDTPTSFEFGDFDNSFLNIPITLSEDTSTDESIGTVTVTATTPGTNNLTGAISTFTFGCIDND